MNLPATTRPVPVPTLDQLLADPSRVHELSCEVAANLAIQAATLRARVDGLHTALLIRALPGAGPARDGTDRLLDVAEAAERLAVSPDWLYRRAGKLPFTVRLGRTVRFSAQGLEKYLHQRQGR